MPHAWRNRPAASKMIPMQLSAWLNTPLGRRCLANEQRVVRQALDRVFGEQLVQIGGWGSPDTFLRSARTQRSSSTAGDDFRSSVLRDDDPEGNLRLEGRVVDETGNGVGGATVTIDSVPPRSVKFIGRGTSVVTCSPANSNIPIWHRPSKRTWRSSN